MSKPTTEEIERIFDEGGDVLQYADESTFERPNLTTRRVSLDLVPPMIMRLDRMAGKMGVSRQSLIKVWLNERLDEEDEREARRTAVA